MDIGQITNLMRAGIMEVLFLIAPALVSALIVGLIVALIQATTSIQEQTLTFLPKMLTILIMLALFGGWMFSELRDYTITLFRNIPRL